MFLQLNKWLGYDKPKKDDFNADNQKIDEACLSLSNSMGRLESAQAALETAQASKAGTQALNALSTSLTSHTGDTGVHVTAEEKAAWSSGSGFDMGSYTGNGTLSQKITLGYQPRFGVIFPVNDGVGRVSWTSDQYLCNTGFISQIGCSFGITLNTDGFTVQYSAMGSADGFAIRLNSPSTTYVYFLLK